jgi:hypothetical protein
MDAPTTQSVWEWFDPTDLTHLQAYQVLQQTGIWPEGFIPENVGFPVLWSLHLDARLANLYVSEKLAWMTGEVFAGITYPENKR